MSWIVNVVAIATLFFDAYLALSMLALARMSREYHAWLPPLGWREFGEMPRYAVLLFVVWTGVLAVGCLIQSALAHSTLRGTHKRRTR